MSCRTVQGICSDFLKINNTDLAAIYFYINFILQNDIQSIGIEILLNKLKKQFKLPEKKIIKNLITIFRLNPNFITAGNFVESFDIEYRVNAINYLSASANIKQDKID